MSNLWSCVSTQTTVRSSTGALARNLSGHSTMSSSTSGKRSGVTNLARASQTVTR